MKRAKLTSKKEALRRVAAIEQALKDGFKPPGALRGRNEKAALAVAAERLGVSRLTLAAQVAEGGFFERLGVKVDWSLYRAALAENTDAPADANAEKDRRIVALEDEVNELRARLKAAHRESLDIEAIRQILGGAAAQPEAPPAWTLNGLSSGPAPAETPVTIWSDWHAGETVTSAETNGVNRFDMATLERRVKRLVERTIDLLRNHGPGVYPGGVVNLLGDFVSGGIHPELLKTDEEEVLPASLHVRDLLIWALEEMLAYLGALYVVCTSGNHGRATMKPEFKRYVFKNFDWLIYQLLVRHFAGRKEITFAIPDANEWLYRIYGQRYLAMHGDMLGVKGGDGIIGAIGPIMRGETKVGKQSAAIGRDYDVLLMGHWHQQLWLPRIICANALKGFDEFAKNGLRATPSTPSQPLWLVHPKWGRTVHRDVFLEDPGLPDISDWVSFPK